MKMRKNGKKRARRKKKKQDKMRRRKFRYSAKEAPDRSTIRR